ncbi:patatin-like phospholipase family protein [Aquilutibacter rugosus]|uniref:patatin-like phospholipase family protein n=1 Tax=Aquilutibacter rugosus TaxID=3115820 RepID=UPI002F42298C
MPRAPSESEQPLALNLALQGGGSHGALTWGVLDRLLEEPRLRIAEVSGTSAGAMNAVVLATGYAHGGAEGARAALGAFWKAVSDGARFSPIQRSLWDRLAGNYSLDRSPGYLMLESLSRMFSPYELNPLDYNPLRDIVQERVDFDAINSDAAIRVHVTATNVRTGQAKTFSTGALSSDAVMASACLPQSFKAVEIDGEAYWDGGYYANPALFPLVTNTASNDVLIVQINPLRREEVPRSARDIINRVNELSFNTSLIKELRTLGMLRDLVAQGLVSPDANREVHLHMIHGEADVQELAASSKMNAEWRYLKHLFERGRIWADDWLEHHLEDVGRRSSFSLDELFRPNPRPAGLGPLEENG